VSPRRQAQCRRRLLQAGALLTCSHLCPALGKSSVPVVPAKTLGCSQWPDWQAFAQQFLSQDGRVIDRSSARAHSVSEAQAYALFFSLVANDAGRFEQLLRWTQDNLAAGDLSMRLPAWLWGRRDNGSWGVIDENSASDADLWIAYALGEAGRLWRERRYVALSSLLAERILREESAALPGLGRTLLPGAQGFALAEGRWRLNPSYAPLFLLRWFAARSADARWQELLQSSLILLRESSPRGFAPDWAFYRARPQAAVGDRGAGYFETTQLAAAERVGGYDAIRVYLWLGLTSRDEPARAPLLAHFAPMGDLLAHQDAPPETLDVIDGKATGEGPAGFSEALLPFLAALERDEPLRAQERRLQVQSVRKDAYYEQVLHLFSTGWREGRFAFGADGSLVPAWAPCVESAH